MSDVTPTAIPHRHQVLWLLLAAAGAWVVAAGISSLLPGEWTLGQSDWVAWRIDAAIVVPMLFVSAAYVAGMRTERRRTGSALRASLFFSGMAAVFLALESLIEALADHSLVVHQVEHMLLRSTGPMLLVLSQPQAALIRGMPTVIRRAIVGPLVASAAMRRSMNVLGHPLMAAGLFVAISTFWMLPRFHDLSLLSEPVHWTWHASLLLTGLLFFFKLFDPRPVPSSPSIVSRLLMCWLAEVANIGIGFYISFSATVLYPAYGAFGLLGGAAPLSDQHRGGATMWIVDSIMIGIAAMIAIYRCAAQEERRAVVTPGSPVRAADVALVRRQRNQMLALGLLGFVVLVLCVMAVFVIGYRHMHQIQS